MEFIRVRRDKGLIRLDKGKYFICGSEILV
jgi:hypothetical protein